jgi:GH24 family phage-related lysozyme (muramidase)
MLEEEFRARKYTDSNGLETIGYGFNIAAGISKRAATALLREQMAERHDELVKLPWYAALNEVRQGVCLDIAINAGTEGLLRFHNMIDALEIGDWPTAAKECSVSNPELAGRYAKLAQLMLTG